MASRQMWQSGYEAGEFGLDMGEYVEVSCSNGSVCRNKLNISHEDAAERQIPQVEGWRQKTLQSGRAYTYCPRCVNDKTAQTHLNMFPKEGF